MSQSIFEKDIPMFTGTTTEQFENYILRLHSQYGATKTKKIINDIHEFKDVRGRSFHKDYLPNVLEIYKKNKNMLYDPHGENGEIKNKSSGINESFLNVTSPVRNYPLKQEKKLFVYAIWAKRANTMTFAEFKEYILKPLVKNNPRYTEDHLYYGIGYIYLETPDMLEDSVSTQWIYDTVVNSQTFYTEMFANMVTNMPNNAQRIEKILGGEYQQMLEIEDIPQTTYVSFFQQLLGTNGNTLISLMIDFAEKLKKAKQINKN
jgi:hypothetical protein